MSPVNPEREPSFRLCPSDRSQRQVNVKSARLRADLTLTHVSRQHETPCSPPQVRIRKRTCCKVVRIHFLDTLMLPGWASRERRIRSLAPLCPRTPWLHYALVEGLKPTAPLFTLTLCPLTFLLRWLNLELPTAVLFVCLPVSLFPSLIRSRWRRVPIGQSVKR